MNVKVLQGLNLKNPVTTVVAEMESVKTDLLDFFKELHPIFMVDYKIVGNANGNTLEVQTHVPSLWKHPDFLAAIEDYSTGKIEYTEAEDKMLELIKIQLSSMSTIPNLHAAHKLGYETIQAYVNEGTLPKKIMNRNYAIGIGREQQISVSAASSKDSSFSKKTQENKMPTNQFIEELGLPIAKWSQAESKEQLPEIAEKLGFPLVIKPVGLTGGHGVHVGIDSLEELEQAWDRIHEYYEKDMKFREAKKKSQLDILCQRVLKGDDYRFLVINGKLEVATHRLQARVTGDGTSTVEQLINEENKNPARDIRLPTHTLKPIVIDKDLKKVLEKQNLSLDYVPKKDEVVRVRDVASMSQGGITADVTDKVHPQIKYICESLAKSVHAYVLGIDILCQDVGKPLTLENGGIIEMNTMPEIYLNTYPVIGRSYPEAAENYIKGLVGDVPRTNKTVVVGKFDASTIAEAMAKELGDVGRYGRLNNGTIYINDEEINSGLSTNEAVLCLKKNASLDTIALHYDSVSEVESDGLGFNKIDLLIVDKTSAEELKAKTEEYAGAGHIKKVVEQ